MAKREDERSMGTVNKESLTRPPVTDPDADSQLIEYVENIILKGTTTDREERRDDNLFLPLDTNNFFPDDQNEKAFIKSETSKTGSDVLHINNVTSLLEDENTQAKQESILSIQNLKDNKKTVLIITFGVLLSTFLIIRKRGK